MKRQDIGGQQFVELGTRILHLLLVVFGIFRFQSMDYQRNSARVWEGGKSFFTIVPKTNLQVNEIFFTALGGMKPAC